jgi:hypothetical protein
MTEAEAKAKDCPLHTVSAMLAAFVTMYTTANGGRTTCKEDAIEKAARCKGSDCPMWRWDENSVGANKTKRSGEDLEGYCGLAGKP